MRTSNLFQSLCGLRFRGIGAQATRTIYRDAARFWIITRVEKSGKRVYGRLVSDGILHKKEELIRSSLKKQWKIIGFPDYNIFAPTEQSMKNLLRSLKVATDTET